jgi:hypothetical protein
MEVFRARAYLPFGGVKLNYTLDGCQAAPPRLATVGPLFAFPDASASNSMPLNLTGRTLRVRFCPFSLASPITPATTGRSCNCPMCLSSRLGCSGKTQTSRLAAAVSALPDPPRAQQQPQPLRLRPQAHRRGRQRETRLHAGRVHRRASYPW